MALCTLTGILRDRQENTVPGKNIAFHFNDGVRGSGTDVYAPIVSEVTTGAAGEISVQLETGEYRGRFQASGSQFEEFRLSVPDLATADIGDYVDQPGDPITPVGHTHTPDEVGLGSVDNTSDADKPISTAQQAAIDQIAGDVATLADGAFTSVSEIQVAPQVTISDGLAWASVEQAQDGEILGGRLVSGESIPNFAAPKSAAVLVPQSDGTAEIEIMRGGAPVQRTAFGGKLRSVEPFGRDMFRCWREGLDGRCAPVILHDPERLSVGFQDDVARIFVVGGQSLADGAIATVQYPGALFPGKILMPNGGVDFGGYSNGVVTPLGGGEISELVDAQNVGSVQQPAVCLGQALALRMGRQLVEMLPPTLVMEGAIGGQPLDVVFEGQALTNFEVALTRAKAAFEARGYTKFEVTFFDSHGETNPVFTAQQYEDRYRASQDARFAMAETIFGDQLMRDPVCFFFQAGFIGEPSRAQWRLHDGTRRILVGPYYDNIYADNAHPDGVSEFAMWERAVLAYQQVVVMGGRYDPLMIVEDDISWDRGTGVLRIPYTRPEGALVQSDDSLSRTLPNASAFDGMYIDDAANPGPQLPLPSLAYVDGAVEVTFQSPPAAGTTLLIKPGRNAPSGQGGQQNGLSGGTHTNIAAQSRHVSSTGFPMHWRALIQDLTFTLQD